MPQERMESAGTTQRGVSDSYRAPDFETTLSRAAAVTQKVRVVHGANEGYYELEGKTVGSVKKSLREVFNIPGDASALIEGKEVGDDFILEGGMNLEFSKEAGVKGTLVEELADKMFDPERYSRSLKLTVDLLVPTIENSDSEEAGFLQDFSDRLMERAPEMCEKSRAIYVRELPEVFDQDQQEAILRFLTVNPWYLQKMEELNNRVQPQLHEMGVVLGNEIVSRGLDFQQNIDG